ncbi:DNA-directed RNA polymerase II subunit 4 isoform X2 [Ziziphus jujuba]|uniref:DNA-directed RNA polymerase II subunit 4 isoform X2 n=1 Tax=Ziziphus jujuba TaxID=326968 RepID=A0ABM3IIA0_ZIZJJ|nr:DNA-directed RNA polymerase II subunit 4 isoform X2 [Ziziphus jujuba]
MNCEVSILLEHRCDQLKHLSDDSLKQLPQVFKKALQYVKRFSRFTNQDAVKQVREVLSRYQLAEYELAVLGNLCPETVEEANAVVPYLVVVDSISFASILCQQDTNVEHKVLQLVVVPKFQLYPYFLFNMKFIFP